MILHSSLLARVRAAQRLPDLQHGRGLHDLLYARGIVDAGQLHEDLILAQAVLLNGRFTDTKLIDTVANGFDRLFNGSRL